MTELESRLINEVKTLNEKFDMLLDAVTKSSSVAVGSNKTFGVWLNEWYEAYKIPKGLKPSYLERIRKYIDKYLLPKLGDIRLCDLDGATLQNYINGLTAVNARKKQSLIINESLNKAVALQLIPHNPFTAVDLPKSKSKHYRPLEYDEQVALLKEVTTEKYKAVMWVLCCTGMRIGELLALNASDIDYRNGVIRVDKDMDIQTGTLNDTPKTETSIRTIPFLPSLEPYLKVLSQTPLTYNGIRLYFKRKYAKFGFKGLNLHSFRHTFISLCYAAGISLKKIQAMAGHSDVNLTLNVYTHVLKKGGSKFLQYIKQLKKEVDC